MLLRFVRDSKIGLARKQGVNLNEIIAVLLELDYCLPTFGFVSYSNRAAPDRFWSIHNRAGDDHAGRQQSSRLGIFSALEMYWSAPHYPHSGDAVGDEEIKRILV